MTTPEAAIAKAAELANVIEREYPGFDAPVPEVWCTHPADKAGICGQTGAQHCAGSVWRIYDEIGLVAGRDYPIPDNGLFVYCPDIAAASDAGGFTVDEPEPGDCLLLDWEGDGKQDHATLCIAKPNWPASVTVRGFNTDDTGHGIIHERPAGVVSHIIRPRWPGGTVGTATPAGPQADTPAGRVYAWCRANGWSDAGAAALLGNLQQESNFWWSAVEGRGELGEVPEEQMLGYIVPGVREGVGVLQWSYERRDNLLAYCHEVGLPWYAPEAQLGFLQEELSAQPDLLARVKSATDPVDAARWLDDEFIRSGDKGNRFDYAQQQYDAITAGAYTPATTTPPAPPRLTTCAPDGDLPMILKVPLPDGSGHDMFYIIGGVLKHADPLIRMDGSPVVVWFNSQEEFNDWYAKYCYINRLNAFTGQYL